MITQTSWFERKFDFNFPIGLLPIILERLRGTIFQLEASIKNIPEEQLTIKKDDKWSVKEVIDRVKNIDETTASIVALHPRLQTPMRLIDSLFFVAEHDDHELGKIRRLIENIEN